MSNLFFLGIYLVIEYIIYLFVSNISNKDDSSFLYLMKGLIGALLMFFNC